MRLKIVPLIVLLAINLTALGQNETKSFSLKEAQDYAIEYNKTLKNAELDVLSARKKIWETIASGLPQVDAKADYSNYLGAEMMFSFDPNMPASAIPFNPTSTFSLTVSQLIFSGSYIVGLQTAKIYQQLSETAYEKGVLTIKENVNNTYSLILVNELTRDILKKNLANLKDTYTKTESMYSVGMVERTDVDQLSVSVNMLENQIRSADRQVVVSYNMLRYILGLPADTQVELTDKLDQIIEQINFTVLASYTLNVRSNTDFRLMETQNEIAQKQVTLSKMSYLPTLAGFYQNSQKILKPKLDFSPKNVVGLNLSVPIFSSGLRKSQVDQAKIALEKSNNDKALLYDNLKIEESQLRFNLNTAVEKYNSQKQNVEVADRVNKNIELKFSQGTVSSLDLTQANNSYLAAEGDFIGATMELLKAYTSWMKLLNNL